MGRKRGPPSGPVPGSRDRLPFRPDEDLDLHGHTVAEAMAAVEMALARWSRSGGAVIRVVHGHSAGDQGTIRGALRRNLETVWKGRVLGHKPEPGNPGATLIRVGRTGAKP